MKVKHIQERGNKKATDLLCKWQQSWRDILTCFQLCGVHLPSYSHTASHTDPLRAKLQTLMSCLTAACANHKKQFYVQLTTAEGAKGTRKTLSEVARCQLEQAAFLCHRGQFYFIFHLITGIISALYLTLGYIN